MSLFGGASRPSLTDGSGGDDDYNEDEDEDDDDDGGGKGKKVATEAAARSIDRR